MYERLKSTGIAPVLMLCTLLLGGCDDVNTDKKTVTKKEEKESPPQDVVIRLPSAPPELPQLAEIERRLDAANKSLEALLRKTEGIERNMGVALPQIAEANKLAGQTLAQVKEKKDANHILPQVRGIEDKVTRLLQQTEEERTASAAARKRQEQEKPDLNGFLVRLEETNRKMEAALMRAKEAEGQLASSVKRAEERERSVSPVPVPRPAESPPVERAHERVTPLSERFRIEAPEGGGIGWLPAEKGSVPVRQWERYLFAFHGGEWLPLYDVGGRMCVWDGKEYVCYGSSRLLEQWSKRETTERR